MNQCSHAKLRFPKLSGATHPSVQTPVRWLLQFVSDSIGSLGRRILRLSSYSPGNAGLVKLFLFLTLALTSSLAFAATQLPSSMDSDAPRARLFSLPPLPKADGGAATVSTSAIPSSSPTSAPPDHSVPVVAETTVPTEMSEGPSVQTSLPPAIGLTQPGKESVSESTPSPGELPEIQTVGSLAPSDDLQLPYSISAAFILAKGTNRGSIRVIANIDAPYRIYAIENVEPTVTPSQSTATPLAVVQPIVTGPLMTRIQPIDSYVKLGPFTPTNPPNVSTDLEGYEGVRVEWHDSSVIWTADLELDSREHTYLENFADPQSSHPTEIEVEVVGQICSDNCIPIHLKVIATFAGYYDSPSELSSAPDTASASIGSSLTDVAVPSRVVSSFRETDSRAEWQVYISDTKLRPGANVELIIRGVPDPGFHLYQYEARSTDVQSETLIVLDPHNGVQAGHPIANKPLQPSASSDPTVPAHYDGPVEWKIPLKISADHPTGEHEISGEIAYHVCSDEQCDRPRGFAFQLKFNLQADATSDPNSIPAPSVNTVGEITAGETIYTATSYHSLSKRTDRSDWILPATNALGEAVVVGMQSAELATGGSSEATLPLDRIGATFCLAVFGGLLLNFMPCVLPVIGLKILGFVTEGSGDRSKTSKLTLVYSLGIFAVILCFGGISLIVREITGQAFGWGEHFGFLGFRIAATVFMFALALSFLGIWTVPIPGFAMTGKAANLSRESGYTGAFCKGVVTTLLATPCSAPFLGSALVVAIAQPAWIVMTIFGGVAFGMALPYLIISCQPSLLAWIPKPGPWTETFKELLAFPMLLSVVMFVNGFAGEQKMAMVYSLIFVWFGCWLIGRVPAWVDWKRKWANGSLATLAVVAGTFASFHWMQPSEHELKWVPYNEEHLQQLVKSGKSVMIDFTAEWCVNCKENLDKAIHTKSVKSQIESQGIIAMEADLTDYPDHIKRKLAELKSISIPLLAIYRPGDVDQPIVLRDRLKESDVLNALHQVAKGKTSESGTIEFSESSTAQQIPMVQATAVRTLPMKNFPTNNLK